MFDKMLKKAKKAQKAKEKEVEDAKSPEQKEYEKMQLDRQKEAEDFATEAKRKLLEMGYAYRPVVSHFDQNRPDLMVANIVFVQVPFSQWSATMAAIKQREEEEARKGQPCCEGGNFGESHKCMKQNETAPATEEAAQTDASEGAKAEGSEGYEGDGGANR